MNLYNSWYRFERFAYSVLGWKWLPGITLQVMDHQHHKSKEGI